MTLNLQDYTALGGGEDDNQILIMRMHARARKKKIPKRAEIFEVGVVINATKPIMIHSSLSPINERLAENCNFIRHHFKIGAENVCITFITETAGSVCAAKRVNSEGRVRGCGLGDCSRAR